MKIVLSVTHPYLDRGRVGARDGWKIAGAEKGGDQVIPRILLILISSQPIRRASLLVYSVYSLPALWPRCE